MASQAQRAEDYSGITDRYIEQGATRADKLGNRGPIVFDQSGKLSQHILDAYWETGFYVFEGLVGSEEIKLLREEMAELLKRMHSMLYPQWELPQLVVKEWKSERNSPCCEEK